MKMCPSHWDELRRAIDDKGLGHLVSSSGEALENRLAKGELDPLFAANTMICNAANTMICNAAIDCAGIELLWANPDGSSKCPLCELQKAREAGIKEVGENHPDLPETPSKWISDCTDALVVECRKRNLIAQAH